MNASLKAVLGARIRAARQRADLTQESLAAQVGRSAESISNIERGAQLPSVDTLIELARILQTPVSEWLEEDGPPIRSAERLAREAQLREIGRSLSDRDLTIALEQISAFRRHSS